MEVIEQALPALLLEDTACQFIGRDGVTQTETTAVLHEHSMEIRIQGSVVLKLVCTPQFLTELILGRLLTEGLIRSEAQVERLTIHGNLAEVLLRDMDTVPLSPVTPIPWRAEQVFSLADRFAGGTPLHGKTCAAHSCFLAHGDEMLFQCEDLGRHNALDKAVGFALRNGIPLECCIVYTSGRVPTDMAMKAIRAGIPVLASKAAPTREAVELAAEYGLTLVCAARKDRMKLFAGMLPH